MRNLLLVLAIFLSFSCAPRVGLQIPLPDSPVLEQCPAKPVIDGRVSQDGQSVVLSMEKANELKNWILEYRICMESNQLQLEGYIQQLLNRLEAVND